MTKKPKPSNIHELRNLPEDLQEMWDLAGENKPEQVVSERETEHALASIWGKIEQKPQEKRSSRRWMFTVAASLLFAFFTGYFTLYTHTEIAPAGETLSVTLPDGSTVTLNSSTEISYKPLFGLTHRNVHLNGEASFDVVSDPGLAFTVHSPQLQTVVLGTVFEVSDWKHGVFTTPGVQVFKGSVSVSNSLAEVQLNDNEMVFIDKESNGLSAVTKGSPDFSSLQNGRLYFSDVSIQEFFERMEFHYGQDIRVELNAPEDYRISGSYRISASLSEIIQDISTIKGLSYQKIHNGYIIAE